MLWWPNNSYLLVLLCRWHKNVFWIYMYMYPIDSIIWFFSCNGELVSGFFLNECTELQCTFVDWPLGYDTHMYVKFWLSSADKASSVTHGWLCSDTLFSPPARRLKDKSSYSCIIYESFELVPTHLHFTANQIRFWKKKMFFLQFHMISGYESVATTMCYQRWMLCRLLRLYLL